MNFPTAPLLVSLREGGRGLNDSQTVLLVKENILESSPVTSGRAGGWKTEFQSWFWLFSDKDPLAPEHLTLHGGHVSTLGKTKDDGQVWVRLQRGGQTWSESHELQVLIRILSLTSGIPLGGCHSIAEAPPLPVQ